MSHKNYKVKKPFGVPRLLWKHHLPIFASHPLQYPLQLSLRHSFTHTHTHSFQHFALEVQKLASMAVSNPTCSSMSTQIQVTHGKWCNQFDTSADLAQFYLGHDQPPTGTLNSGYVPNCVFFVSLRLRANVLNVCVCKMCPTRDCCICCRCGGAVWYQIWYAFGASHHQKLRFVLNWTLVCGCCTNICGYLADSCHRGA